MARILAMTIVALLFACSGSESKAVPDVTADATSREVAAPGDAGGSETSDALLDAGSFVEAGEVAGPACETPGQGVLLPSDSGTTRFAMSVYHYNVQYVAGGLKGLFDRPEVDLDEAQVEDRIVTESLVPLLEALDAHPTWGVDVELQGYMLEIMRQRHPGVLEQMRNLVAAGQLHVDSFHYSDQLWTAHPKPSMVRSEEFNLRSFEEACLPVGKAVFSQEGQFGHGMARLIHDSGRIALLPTNLHKYHYGGGPVKLMYELDGTPVVVAGRDTTEEVGGETFEVNWHFVNDGELAFTGNGNPYFGTVFRYDKASSEKYIAKLEQLEADGWRIATIADFAAHLDEAGYEPSPLPLILDGTWQPKDTQNHYLWMGQAGVFGETEDDNGVLTALTKSRILIQAAEMLWLNAESEDPFGPESLDVAWRHQLLAEVSDSTGWNPWEGEVLYSKTHAAYAANAAWEVFLAVQPAGKAGAVVDTSGGEAGAGSDFPYYVAKSPEAVELAVTCVSTEGPFIPEVQADGWVQDFGWCKLESSGMFMLTISLQPSAQAKRDVVITVPRSGDTLAYVPALLEDEPVITQFDVQTLMLDDTATLGIGLANGLLGIGEDNWILKPTAEVHMAAMIPQAEEVVRFENHSQNTSADVVYRFFYFQESDPEAAAELANRLNVWPVVKFEID